MVLKGQSVKLILFFLFCYLNIYNVSAQSDSSFYKQVSKATYLLELDSMKTFATGGFVLISYDESGQAFEFVFSLGLIQLDVNHNFRSKFKSIVKDINLRPSGNCWFFYPMVFTNDNIQTILDSRESIKSFITNLIPFDYKNQMDCIIIKQPIYVHVFEKLR